MKGKVIDLIKLLKNAEVYAPACLGKKDVLVIADKRSEERRVGKECGS